jgi:hypothetical protein
VTPSPALDAPLAPGSRPQTAGAVRAIEIRLAVSDAAARTLSEPRVRRLVEIETESFAVLAPRATGPLGDHVGDVWVDQPGAAKIIVETRVGDRAVERREIAVRGLAGDVAARLVAIAVSEMVRAGMAPRPLPPPPPPPPPQRTADELERAGRAAPAVMVSAAGVFAALPAVSGVLGGPSLALAFRRFGLSESLFGRWLVGSGGGSGLRWLELGLSADYRLWLGRSWRLALGGSGAFSSLHLADATAIEGQAGQRESWSARAGGLLAIEARLTAPVVSTPAHPAPEAAPHAMWISLGVDPGAILRPVHFAGAAGATGVIEGAWLGLGLALHFERVGAPDP